MNLNIDFVLLIAVLVLIQLFVLSADVDKNGKSKKTTGNKRNRKVDTLNEEAINTTLTDNKELSLVVYRSNGEEKIYKKSDVA